MKNIIRLIEETTANTLNGELNPLEVFIDLKRLEACVSECKEALKEYTLQEAKKYGSQFEFSGAKINIRSGAGRWKFDHLNDWNHAKNGLKEIEELHKSATKMQDKGAVMIDPDGVVVEPAIYEPGAEVIAVSL